MSDLSEEISELKSRITILEEEVGTSYEEQKFEHIISAAVVRESEAEVDIRDGHWGHHAFIRGLTIDELNHAMDSLDKEDVGVEYEVIETGGNLGIEVWVNERLA